MHCLAVVATNVSACRRSSGYTVKQAKYYC